MSNAIKVERVENGIVIRFARPDARNPLSTSVIDELNGILDLCENDRDIEKIIFTGSENVFASGADLREIANLTSNEAKAFAERGQRVMRQISGLPQMTIASINGYCFGGALDLALACDIRIASPNATFCHPGTGLGIITGWGGTQRLSRLIGEAKTLEMFFTAQPINAREALRIGLVDLIASDPLEEAKKEPGKNRARK